MMHRVHSEMFVLCKEFISLFIKAEFIPEKSMKELLAIDLKNPDIQLCNKYLNVGKFAYSQVLELWKKKVNWISSFYKNLREAYIFTATYMFKNLPLNNKVLIWLSALNPQQRKCSTTLSAFEKLSEKLSQVVNPSNRSCFIEEYTTDNDIAHLEAAGLSHTATIVTGSHIFFN